MQQPRLITVPYSFNQSLFEAYNSTFELVNSNDWVCFKDGDACFLEMSDFGGVLSQYIERYPNTGIFTSYASRCHYKYQTIPELDQEQDSIKYWAEQSIKAREKMHLQAVNVKPKIAGHLIMMKKEIWETIKPKLQQKLKANPKHILGFDNWLSRSVLECGYDIKVMRGVLLFHYLRFLTGKNKFLK